VFFIGLLHRDLNPTNATPFTGYLREGGNTLSEIFHSKDETMKEALQKSRGEVTKFETETDFYVVVLSKSNDTVKLYSFSRDELQKNLIRLQNCDRSFPF
jgi:hypothetical protein